MYKNMIEVAQNNTQRTAELQREAFEFQMNAVDTYFEALNEATEKTEEMVEEMQEETPFEVTRE